MKLKVLVYTKPDLLSDDGFHPTLISEFEFSDINVKVRHVLNVIESRYGKNLIFSFNYLDEEV